MIEWIADGLARITRWWNRRRALRLFRWRLGPALVRRYGRAATYTPKQIRRTVNAIGLADVDLRLAYAMFTDRRSFAALQAQSGESWEYSSMLAAVHSSSSHEYTCHHDSGHHGHAHHDAGGGHHHGHDVVFDTHHHHHH